MRKRTYRWQSVAQNNGDVARLPDYHVIVVQLSQCDWWCHVVVVCCHSCQCGVVQSSQWWWYCQWKNQLKTMNIRKKERTIKSELTWHICQQRRRPSRHVVVAVTVVPRHHRVNVLPVSQLWCHVVVVYQSSLSSCSSCRSHGGGARRVLSQYVVVVWQWYQQSGVVGTRCHFFSRVTKWSVRSPTVYIIPCFTLLTSPLSYALISTIVLSNYQQYPQ